MLNIAAVRHIRLSKIRGPKTLTLPQVRGIHMHHRAKFHQNGRKFAETL